MDKNFDTNFCDIYENLSFSSLEGTIKARVEMAKNLNVLLVERTEILNQLVQKYEPPEITVYENFEYDDDIVEQAKFALTGCLGLSNKRGKIAKYKPLSFTQLSLKAIINTSHDIKLSSIINAVRNKAEHTTIKGRHLKVLEVMEAEDPQYKIIQYIADSILAHFFSLYVSAKLENTKNSLLYYHHPPSDDKYIKIKEEEYLSSKVLDARCIDQGYTFMLAIDMSDSSQQSPLPTIFSIRFLEYPMFKENPCFEVSVLKNSNNTLLIRLYCNGYEYITSSTKEVTSWHSLVVSIKEVKKRLKILLRVDGSQCVLERNIPVSLKEAKYVTTVGANSTKTNQSIVSIGSSVGSLGYYNEKAEAIESIVEHSVRRLRYHTAS